MFCPTIELRILVLLLALVGPQKAWAELEPVTQALRARLEGNGAGLDNAVPGATLHAVGALQHFYRQREYRPAWLVAGRGFSLAEDLLTVVNESSADGLKQLNQAIKMARERLKGASLNQ